MLKNSVLLCFLCAAGIVFFSAAQASSDPRQCVLAAGEAIDGADAVAFERAVDLDSLLEQALDVFLRKAQQPGVAEKLPPMLAILFAQSARSDETGTSIRALLRKEARAFVVNGIASGAFAGKKPTGQAAQGLLAPLFADASTGRKEIRQVGTARADAKGWLVPFVLYDWGNGQSYEIVGRIVKKNDALQLVSLANMDALVQLILEEGMTATTL